MYNTYDLKKQMKEEISMMRDEEACQPMWIHFNNLCQQYNNQCKNG
tara:strand:+ start:5772 stop:5909 length:138 start_codon:yes stop_codon:yes gene_type:complete